MRIDHAVKGRADEGVVTQAQLTRTIQNSLGELQTFERMAHANASVEAWHGLRTASRRLRGVLDVFVVVLPITKRAKIRKLARRVTKLPAKVRDLDVALELLSAAATTATDQYEERAIEELRTSFEKQRNRRVRKAQREIVQEQPTEHLVKLLSASVPCDKTPKQSAAKLQANLEARLKSGRHKVLIAMERADDGNVEAAHELRLAVKRLRNTMLALLEQSSTKSSPLRFLKQVQDTLGAHHDYGILEQHAQHRAKKLLAEGHSKRSKGCKSLATHMRLVKDKEWCAFEGKQRQRLHTLVAVVGNST